MKTNNSIKKIRYLLAFSLLKQSGAERESAAAALLRGAEKYEKRKAQRRTPHPFLKRFAILGACVLLCAVMVGGIILLVNRGKIPLPQPETSASVQTDLPDDAVGLVPYDAGSGELFQIVLLHKTLAFDYMNSASFNAAFDPSSQSEVVAYNSDWTTSYIENIYDYHRAYDSSQKVSVLMTHIPFASDVRLVDNDRDTPNVAFPFPQVLEYVTDAETGFSYALVCSFYYDLSQATVSSITSYDLKVKQDGMYTDAGRYDLSEQKLYFKAGVTLPCVLYKYRPESGSVAVYNLTKLSCTAAYDGNVQRKYLPEGSPEHTFDGSSGVVADDLLTGETLYGFLPASDPDERRAACAATNALGLSGIIPIAYNPDGGRLYGIPYTFDRDRGSYVAGTSDGVTRVIFPNDNFVIKVNASQAPELTVYAFYYSDGWKYEAVGSLCDMPLVPEFRELTKPLYDEAKTERESEAKLLSQLEEYSPYYSYTLPDGKDVCELLDEYLINPDYLSGRTFGGAFIADGYMYTQAGSFIVPEIPQPPSKPYNCDKALSLCYDNRLTDIYYVLGTDEFSSPYDSYETVRLLSVDRRGELAINDGLICGMFYNDDPYMLCDIDNLNIRSVTFYSDGTVADISAAGTPLPVNYTFEIYAFDRLEGGLYVHDLYGYYGGDGCMLGSDIKIRMYKSALTGEEGEITFYRADCRLDYYNATYFLEYTTSSGSTAPYYINPNPPYLYFTGGCVYSLRNDSNGNTYLSVPGSPYETIIPNSNGNCNRTFTSTIFYLPD